MKYFEPKLETMSASKKKALQLERLKNAVRYCYDKVPHYKKKMDEAGAHPKHLQTLKDIAKFPITTKEDLRLNYPYGLFAVPMRRVVRVHASSGTTGKSTVVGYTKHDLHTWATLVARGLVGGGATEDSIIQNAHGYGLFTGGIGVHYGAELLGATIIPASGGNTKRQILMLQDYNPDMLICTPSYSLYIAEVGREMGVDFSRLALRNGMFGGEPWSESMRNEMQKSLAIKAHDIYGISEVMGPGVGMECGERKGPHINDDHFYPEIVDEAGAPVETGEQGELLFTSLTKEAFPILRYRTKDVTRIITEPCACGRTTCRIARITGRADDMLIIRGVNVFPSQIEEALVNIEGAEPHYQIVVRREGALDDIEVQVEVSETIFSDKMTAMETLRAKISREMESALGISVNIKLVEPKSIARSEGKAQRVIDMRTI